MGDQCTEASKKQARTGREEYPPEEEDVDRDGADVPDGVGIQDPEERREV